MATQKQIDANRANALNSTGPQTPAGKAAVRLNALKHGLTAQDAVLPFEDKDQFDEIAKAYEEHYQPLGPVEILLVQQIVMAAWRLCRVRGMETAAIELRLAQYASGLDHECRGLSGVHRLASVFLRDARDANSLTILPRYEARVERSFYRALHELQRLQATRPPAPLAPAPASKNDSAEQSQIAPDPLPQKDLTPPSPQSPNLRITQSPNHRPAANQTNLAAGSSAGAHPGKPLSRIGSTTFAERAMPSKLSAKAA